jgi:hypothetical protein
MRGFLHILLLRTSSTTLPLLLKTRLHTTVSKMVRTKSSKPVRGTSFMFPSLHQNIVKAVSHDNISTRFHENNSDEDSNNKYSTHVMGRFQCYNNACSATGWSSKMVAISIRGYPGNGYNAVVFNQRCMACKRLGSFTLDVESYIGRVAYRLKKWAGVSTEQQYYAPKEGPPHERDLCEGCKRGVCRQRDVWD